MRLKGKLIEWNDDRGFGFVEPMGGGERAFCHISAFANRSRRPTVGEIVTYELKKDERGRTRATQIKRADASKSRAPSKRTDTSSKKSSSPRMSIFVSTLFLIGVAALTLSRKLPWFVPLIYVALSGIAMFAYAFDKSAAMNRRWRAQESTLLMIGLLGGWPGAWIAQRIFRHKTQKTSFRFAFLFTVLVNAGVLVWVVSDPTSSLGQVLWSL
ncbi:MAG TPA: cold shock and DUF1294 domain-containing protein [Steroidobacteraceae bacterium]|nr:cold shock and DUF1294 domain-containing protein [Steroidobacteraceae bacterium]